MEMERSCWNREKGKGGWKRRENVKRMERHEKEYRVEQDNVWDGMVTEGKEWGRMTIWQRERKC